jgi:hypothetical protein
MTDGTEYDCSVSSTVPRAALYLAGFVIKLVCEVACLGGVKRAMSSVYVVWNLGHGQSLTRPLVPSFQVSLPFSLFMSYNGEPTVRERQ